MTTPNKPNKLTKPFTFNRLIVSSVLVSSLIACGGGAGGTGGVQTADSGSSTTTAAPNTSATDKYLASWKSPCGKYVDIVSNGANANATQTLVLTANTTNTVSGNFVLTVYSPTDTTCSSTVIGTMSRAMSMVIDGVGSGTGGADQVTLTTNNSAVSGTTVTIGTVTYLNGGTLGVTNKELMLVSGNTLRNGGGAKSSTTYPTALNTDYVFTKQ
jgi:hypothetical protein